MNLFLSPLDEANRLVSILLPSAYFEAGSFQGRPLFFLRVTTHIAGPSIPIMLGGDGSRLCLRRHESRYGDATNRGLAQLFRFATDQNRRPPAWWAGWLPPEYWTAMEPAMRATAYGDPPKTACVLCGGADPLDWWNGGDTKAGPCCGMARCRPANGDGAYSEAITPARKTSREWTDAEIDAI